MASLRVMDGFSRVDDVRTHTAFRGRLFATELMKHLAAYHARISDNRLYLWATNPVAIRMYRNVGFGEFRTDRPIWSAYVGGISTSP
jgi:predicted GNAT family acetyltransferase